MIGKKCIFSVISYPLYNVQTTGCRAAYARNTVHFEMLKWLHTCIHTLYTFNKTTTLQLSEWVTRYIHDDIISYVAL